MNDLLFTYDSYIASARPMFRFDGHSNLGRYERHVLANYGIFVNNFPGQSTRDYVASEMQTLEELLNPINMWVAKNSRVHNLLKGHNPSKAAQRRLDEIKYHLDKSYSGLDCATEAASSIAAVLGLESAVESDLNSSMSKVKLHGANKILRTGKFLSKL